MLAVLVFAAVQGQQELGATLDAKVYEARFDGPAYAALIQWSSFEAGRASRSSHNRKVTITVTDRGTRCDTDGWISVVKTERNEYFLIDHKKRTVLIYPPGSWEQGRRAVCATTPLWPEAFGDGAIFPALSKNRESLEHITYASRTKLLGDKIDDSEIWWYVTKGASYYHVIERPYEGFHNLTWWVTDHRGLETSWFMSFRGPEIARRVNLPVAKSETVTTAFFGYPKDYDVLVAGSNDGYTGSKRADKDEVRQYVADFEIPAVFSVKNVFSPDGASLR